MTTPGDDRWIAELADALGVGPAEAADAARRFPAGYDQQVPAGQAALDVGHLAALDETDAPAGTLGPQRFAVSSATGGGDEALPAGVTLRLRRYGRVAVELSAFLPVLESFGLAVVEAVPMAVAAAGGHPAAHIDDFRLRWAGPGEVGLGPADASRLVDAVEAVTTRRSDLDSLNRLVLAAGLDWVQVRLLRAYRRYRRQAGSPLADSALDDPLVEHPAVAAGLVELVETRFDPRLGAERRDDAVADVRRRLLAALDHVEHLEADQVLRGYLALVDATVRTSYFLRDAAGEVPATLTLKLDSRAVPDLPRPHPEVEAWVHGATVEGIHLRFGRVARGGLRWSDRPEDFRTEILDLAAAQVKKNAVIVPTGAKGGFVCRGSEAAGEDVVQAAYRAFVSGLLDVTDNLVDGRVVAPPDVVRADGDDPYLVVAADRGTATFSDLANSLSVGRGFWLGDAFASGGSNGYDHKAMGITAKGAWVAVRRHFHQLGIDVQTERVSVAGVGDMSGDVFGNGMLLSRSLALVAAFDHRHVFLDPDPDPARSFDERARLAALPHSSWDDYDRRLLSEGGGVWPRDAKTVPLHPAARRVLGVSATELSPPELISAILAAPVDLLWFGGIGTYLKAPDEPDVEVGDHANDAVRITSERVRARVIAEGGNLAVTQRGRIGYSRRGGRINTDFIDNAAGVATSDREVNLKILVDLAVARGRFDTVRRDELLRSAEGHVATEVLRQVDHSVSALSRAVPDSAGELDAYEALVVTLEDIGLLDRRVEDLPSAEEMARRRQAGAGLIRPELAVLLSYAKSHLAGEIEVSSLPEDAYLRDAVRPYFPPEVRKGIDDLIPEHRLYPQLVATDVAGEMVDQLGPVWGHETAAELGVGLAEVAAAFWCAREVLGAGDLLARIEDVGTGLSAEAEAELHRRVATSVARLARRYLLNKRYEPAAVIGEDSRLLEELRAGPDPLAGREVPASVRAALDALLVPSGLAGDVTAREALVDVADAQRVAAGVGCAPATAMVALASVDRCGRVAHLDASFRSLVPVGRFASWQVHALLDDLASWRVAAAASALAGRAELSTGDAVAAWVDAHRGGFDRLAGLLGQLDGLLETGSRGGDALALASAVVRRLPC